MKFIYEVVNPWWQGKDFDAGIDRERYLGNLPDRRGREQIETFIGGRGTGKTTLLLQIVKHLLKAGRRPSTILYLPMHYPALQTTTLKEHVWDVEGQVFGHRSTVHYLLVDEFQETLWETEIKEIRPEGLKIFAAATEPPPLRGPGRPSTRRTVTIVHPLNFREFLRFRGLDPAPGEAEGMAALAEEYLLTGGYPSQVIDPVGGALAGITAGAASDIGALHELRKPYLLKDILRRVAGAVGSGITFHQLAGALRMSDDTLGEYIGFLEEVWLVKSLEKWTDTPAERIHAPKKIYLGDNGIRTVLTGEEQMASRAENAVFLEIWHRGIPCGYDGDSGGDVDFVLGSRARPLPVDVRYETAPDGDLGRYDGLKAFIRRFPRTREAAVITRSVEESLRIDKTEVRAVPLWKFLRDDGGFNLR